MTTENTDTANGQHSNPGEGEGAATDAANPNGQTASVPAASGGQGEGGDKPGGDAGNQGEQGKPGGEGGAGDGQGKTDADKPVLTGAPEAYTEFTLPEGFKLEGERAEVAQALFRDLGLSQAGAQRAIDHFIKTVGEDATVQQQAMEAAVMQQRDDWAKQAKTELGDKYDETVAYARTAVQALQNPKLVAAFDELGWGNHPELLKAFGAMGQMMRDSPIDGIGNSGSAAEKPKPWNTLYPDM
jgi:hypothetical protein